MASVGYRTERVLAARLQAEEDLLVGPLPQAVSASAGTDVVGYENIVGVGISERIVAGNLMSEPAIAVYVANKVVRDRVDDPAAVPPSYEGVPTDVIESGEFLPQTERGRYRPAASGVSLGHHAATAGTLGFVARRENAVYVVSNNHVLAQENNARAGDVILQPGPADGGRSNDELARLAYWEPLDFSGGDNLVDAAMAVTESDLVSPNVYGVGRLATASSTPRRDLLVRKRGRTTGLTRGVVRDVDATIKLRYRRGVAILTEQTIVRGIDCAFSEFGDSGSLVFEEQGLQPVGLLCGGSSRFTIVNRIDHVLNVLGLSLMT